MADSVVELAGLAADRADPGRALAAIVELRRRLDELEEFQVENARHEGWSWSAIAEPLEVTRQAVHRKYAKALEDPARGTKRARMVVSAEARRCVVRARREAASLRHTSVGTDHLLLGVLAERRLVPQLAGTAVTLDDAREAVIALRGAQPRGAAAGAIPISARARAALEQSLREAVRLGDGTIGVRHLFLALLRDEASSAVRVLERLGVPTTAIVKRS